ncbi:MAG: VWA domain-containing protein, partial [Pyrinomonadaceae bacterium]|nr:VWA domain-containing protein [Phycisphaerales bacterium]
VSWTKIFADLEASRSGRHTGPIIGEGPTEMPRTRAYEFGDSASNMDITQTFINAMVRTGQSAAAGAPKSSAGFTLKSEDIEIFQTRNNPKAATAVLMDMSGSMRHGGQYINVKRMALALDALIRREYPGDYLRFIEMFSFAKLRQPSEIVAMMPKPVSIHSPVVRLKVDMSNPDVPESRIPQHFTNIQRSMQLARTMLSAQDTPNRQIVLITDGLPTAHFEGSELFLLYPPDPRTEDATMREANLCAREGITINIFLLPSWSQTSEDVQFAQRMAMATSGRVFFTGGSDLDRFVLWDYVAMRRKIIA